MVGQDAEAAAGVLGAQRHDAVLVDDHLQRRDDTQLHDSELALAAAASFRRASSRFPTM